MCSFKSIYFVIFVLNLYKSHAEISDKRLCRDPECSEPVSLAKTLLRYSSPDPRILSFAPNSEVTIYSKEAGSETNLWGAVINGKRGYVPKHLVREYKVFKKPTLLVDTELKQKPQVPAEGDKNDIDPDSVKKSYEIVDGTTIYLNEQDSISPSSTESPILSTALPPGNNAEEQAPSVDNLKDSATEENAQEPSIVDNVLSSFSNLMNDDEDSEEIDAEDDEEDEDEDGDDEEEESLEELESKSQELKTAASDIDSLHNLPSGIKVSPYSLEVNQQLNESVSTKNEETLEGSVVSTVEVLVDPENNTINSTPPATDTIESEKVQQESVVNTEQLTEETEDIAIANSETEAKSTTEKIETSESLQVEHSEPSNKENKDEINSNSEEILSVTEPSTDVNEEQLPILLEDVTTLNPLDIKEQENLKTDDFVTAAPSQNIEENRNEETSPSITENTELPDLPAAVPDSSNSAENQQPTSSDEENPTLSSENSFSPTQNEIQDENKEIENKESISDDTLNEIQNNINENPSNTVDEQSDYPKEEILNNVEEQNENNLPSEDAVLTSTENTENNIEEPATDDQIQEDFKEEPENIVEVPLDNSGEVSEESEGFWSGLFSVFGGSSDDSSNSEPNEKVVEENVWVPTNPEVPVNVQNYCDANSDSCNTSQQELLANGYGLFDNIDLKFNSDFFLLLITTAGSMIVFLFVYMFLDRRKREGPLVARINKLEKELLITMKENELLQEKGGSTVQEDSVPNEVVEQLTQRLAEAQLVQQALQGRVSDLEKQLEAKAALEEQIENLEKELETSAEVGMELNRIISEILDPTNGSEKLKENVEQLQRQLLEQKDTINSISETLKEKEVENRTLRNELERSKKVGGDLQNKLDEMVERILKIEKEKDQQQNSLQNEITMYQQKYSEAVSKEEILKNDVQIIRVQLSEAQRQADIKTKEYQILKESLDKIKSLKNNSDALKSLLDATSIKAEIQQLKTENAAYVVQLQQEQAVKVGFEKKYQAVVEEINLLKERYELADKEKVEVNSKLEVLNNYFKKRESELQEEIIKYKSIWDAKEGEATSTTERIKYMQEEIENYKAQNETLKQEIISQEIDLKSQISMLEKKVHENWVTARQTERKLEDARQEAAQLRNRLTLRERAINEERIQNRLQSPVEQNGELPLSPHPIDSPASPPLLYGARDHITKSPPLPGLPPFLPPPPGAPFMPPPMHGMPPFMPPPPSMYPGDHRPPPLGRMSSPPLNSRYSPDTSAFSPYDRNSPSPPYDSEYGASPPPIRGYSPYNSRDDRRDYKRPPHGRTNGRNAKGSVMSSGSDHSNDSLDKVNRKHTKMV